MVALAEVTSGFPYPASRSHACGHVVESGQQKAQRGICNETFEQVSTGGCLGRASGL